MAAAERSLVEFELRENLLLRALKQPVAHRLVDEVTWILDRKATVLLPISQKLSDDGNGAVNITSRFVATHVLVFPAQPVRAGTVYCCTANGLPARIALDEDKRPVTLDVGARALASTG